MAEQPYHQSCVRCGQQLTPNVSGPETPPWRCDHCHLSWWVAELSTHARLHYRSSQQDWGVGSSEHHKSVREEVRKEQEEAARRGISLRREQLGHVSKKTLHSLAKHHRISSHFAAMMKNAGQ